MYSNIEIIDDLFDIPILPPLITRQHAYSNQLQPTNNSNTPYSINFEIDLNENLFRSVQVLNNINLPYVKKTQSYNKQYNPSVIRRIKSY